MGRSSNAWGRVKWGYSSRPPAKLSSSAEAASPSTPGSSRTAASIRAMAAIFAPRQDEIPQADFLHPAGLDHPLVQAFEPAAEQDRAGPRRQRTHPAWVSGAPRGDR